jgi:hypothetical protein
VGFLFVHGSSFHGGHAKTSRERIKLTIWDPLNFDHGDLRAAVEADMYHGGPKAGAHMERAGLGIEQTVII